MPIITADVLRQMISNGNVSIIKKNQKGVDSYNYYFTPNLGLELYNVVVIATNPKYLVFRFDKRTHLSLLMMLKSINEQLKDYLSRSYIIDTEHTFYDISSEQPETFTLRCSLPQTRGRYGINCLFENQNVRFNLPRNGAMYSKVTLEIRNVWETNKKLGYNLELKYVEI